jgi:hypothetical protein
MRTGRIVLAVAMLLALAGCVPAGQHVASSPTARATPLFASDAEALAAAEKAYAAYLKVSDQIANDGGKDPERITNYVSANRLGTELAGSKTFESNRIRSEGSTAFDSPTFQQVATIGHDTEVAFYACWDASDVRIINPQGLDVTPADRVDRQYLEVVLTTVSGNLPLVLESDSPWSGQSSC